MLVGSVGLGANAVWGSAMGSCTADKLVFGLAALEDDALVVCCRQTETHTTTHTIPGRKVQVKTLVSSEDTLGRPPVPSSLEEVYIRNLFDFNFIRVSSNR